MKTLSITLAAMLTCLGAHAAGAQVEVHGRSQHRLSSDEAAELQGRFALEDGRVLEVSRRGRQMLLVLDGQESPLLALSATRLQSTQGDLQLAFDASANGSIRGLTLTQAGRASVAMAPAARRQ